MINATSKIDLGTSRVPQQEKIPPQQKLQEKKPASKQYKSVPQNWTALPESKFRQVVNHLESVLLEISTDGSSVHIPEGRISPATLNRWATHLRAALKAVTAAK